MSPSGELDSGGRDPGCALRHGRGRLDTGDSSRRDDLRRLGAGIGRPFGPVHVSPSRECMDARRLPHQHVVDAKSIHDVVI